VLLQLWEFFMPIEKVDKDLEDLMEGYLQNRNEDLINLKNALKENNLKTIASISHKVKGSAGGYGLNGLGEIASKLEEKSKTSDVSSCAQLIEEFKKYLLELEIQYL
jgi:HPt (histidine-containing phosphotransfer) domain-containing protein